MYRMDNIDKKWKKDIDKIQKIGSLNERTMV